jgi:hypothetical protein
LRDSPRRLVHQTTRTCASVRRVESRSTLRFLAGRHGGTAAEDPLQSFGRLLRSRSPCMCVGRQYQSTCGEQIVECKSSPVGVLPFPMRYCSCETCFAFPHDRSNIGHCGTPGHRCAVFDEDIQTPSFVKGVADLLFRTSTWVTVLAVVPFGYDQQGCTDTL